MANYKLCNSDQLDSDLTTVADAIRSKGGTSAKLEFPSGYITAIDAISTGITVQKKTGTASIGSKISCGFKPDVVLLTYNKREDEYTYVAGIDFAAINNDNACVSMWASADNYDLYDFYVSRNSVGFKIDESYVQRPSGEISPNRNSISYTAIKYT